MSIERVGDVAVAVDDRDVDLCHVVSDLATADRDAFSLAFTGRLEADTAL